MQETGAAIGASMRSLGVHQGLAPVLDVVRDARWGRVEERIGEDPYLVGTTATAYVRGVQSTGVVATLKHFVGYSDSRAGRNLAPVHAGPCEVADYFAVAFLQTLHGVAGDLGDAGAQALGAGIDVELPTGVAYLAPLAEKVRSGGLDEALVDRALRRVLAQEALGLLAPDHDPAVDLDAIDLDPPAHRALARSLAEESVVLLSNDGTLPLEPGALAGRTVAVVGPDADDTSGFAAAVEAAEGADVVLAVLGDRAGLSGRGTSGEGCDAESLDLPGVQGQLLDALLATGTPVVLVLLTGRPYAVADALERCAAAVQAFFPGQEGAGAVAGVLSGRVDPSGRLPVSLPRSVGSQPYSYLHPQLGAASPVSNIDTAPVRPFGHGLSYTTFERTDLAVAAGEVATDGAVVASVRVTNTGDRAGADVVQLYASDPVASVTRPVAQLLGYARVELEPGASAVVVLDVPVHRLSLSDRAMVRVVEPDAA